MAEIKPKSLYIIDGSSYFYRAFYGIRRYLSNSKNLPTNATYGFATMLLKIIKTEQPDYLAVAFDSKGKTFRHEKFPQYKANRSEMPDDLKPQIPYIHKLVNALNVCAIQKEGVEADDIIGTLSIKAERHGFFVTIVSGDKDMMQLVSDNICMLDTMKNKRIDKKAVREKFGVEPERVIEVMGLMGDASDNIPGVPGIGEKTAIKLIKEFNDIENLILKANEIKSPSMKNKIKEFRDQALLSKELATIVTDLNLEKTGLKDDLENLKTPPLFGNEKIIQLFKELEFSTLLKEFTAKSDLSEKTYSLIVSEKEFTDLLENIKNVEYLSIDTETTSKEPMLAGIVGISLAYNENEAFYIPVAHDYDGVPEQLEKDYVLNKLKPILENPDIKKYGQNIKYEIIVFYNTGIKLKGIHFDTMIASYLLNPSRNAHNLDAIALEFLDYKKISYKDVAGSAKKAVTFNKVDLKQACDYSSEDADITLMLTNRLSKSIEEEGFYKLYSEIELPLVKVLADMEICGVKIDKELLNSMSIELDKKLDILITDIYQAAGEEFNINSTKQLSVILFEKIGLKPLKKTKTGYSTNEAVLEKLAKKHELPAQLLTYRKLNKLKSTYVDALPKLINTETGRIHSSLNQTVTATGRLSSSNPNLQNIPIRTKLGKKIRKAFIAEPGYSVLSADYSQIELRILAHMSGDEALIDAFQKGEDIHIRTASEVMGIFPSMVTKEMRSAAKSVNFGIIYGISAFGLSKDLGISRTEAKEYIDNYLSRYPKVKRFMDKTISNAYKSGYVSTLFDRRRYLPDLQSTNRQVKEFAERTAVNTPIQGTAADIIKIAMINISKELKKEKLRSKMTLQVHDELLFEVEKSEEKELKNIVKKGMEEVIVLKVPLLVDMSIGKNWDEAH